MAEVSENLSRLMLEAALAHTAAAEQTMRWRPDARI